MFEAELKFPTLKLPQVGQKFADSLANASKQQLVIC
jgi:hypothetical protein